MKSGDTYIADMYSPCSMCLPRMMSLGCLFMEKHLDLITKS